jgi:pimeloyl-ACP methyl ester carboxylesterase
MEFALHGSGLNLFLLISGLGTKLYVWKTFMRKLLSETDGRVCIIELSDDSSTKTMAEKLFYILKNVIGWVSEEQTKSKIHIVGWSLGGMVAQKLALILKSQDVPLTLSLLSTTHSFRLGALAFNVPWRKALGLVCSCYSKAQLAQALATIHYPNPEDVPTKAVKTFEKMLERDALYYTSHHLLAVFTHNMSNQELHELKELKPLVICGELDEVVPCRMTLSLARELAVPLVLVPGVGHDPINQSTDLVVKAILQHAKSSS